MTGANRFGAAVLVLLAAIGPSASAEGHAGRTSVGFDLGRTEIYAGSFRNGGIAFNLRFGREIDDHLEAEFGVYGADAEESPLPGVTRGVEYVVFAGNVVYNFHPRESVSPYLLLGVGIGRLEFEAIGLSESETALAIQAAGGCRWVVGKTRRSGIRLELSLGSLERISWSSLDGEGYVRFVGLSVGYVYQLRTARPAEDAGG